MRRIRWNLKFVRKRYVGRLAVTVFAMRPDDDDMAFNGDNTFVYLSKLYTGANELAQLIVWIQNKINKANSSSMCV